jgi:CDP-glycerol glycerophosphotransferase
VISVTDMPGFAAIRRRFLGWGRRIRQAAKTEVYAFWRRRAVRPTVVMYESFAGNGVLCNPEAIFRALLADPEFAGFTHVWVLASARENPTVVREFARSRSVRFVRPASFAYFRALATSGFLVNNGTFPTEFGKRAAQVYLNTWHGTPLKRMGFDIGDPATRVANVIRNLLSADFLLSASPFMTEHLYEKAHRMGQIYRGKIIEEGYPRIDRQFMDASRVAAVRARIEAGGVALDGRKIILYAPTWKGTSFLNPGDDISALVSRVEQLESLIDTSKYVVLLKTHQVVHRFASRISGLRGRLIANEIPSNLILGVTDVLITDYSSIFFDFLATDRPIFFLTPDLADYSGYRGLYIEPNDWPGPVVDTVGALAEAVNDFDRFGVDSRVAAKYRAMQSRFVAREDGNATRRIVDIVFRARPDGYAIAPPLDDGRTTILIAAGSMRPGETTSALVALLDAIDHTRFDVSVIFPSTRTRPVLDQQQLLNPQVRQFARVGGMNGSKFSLARLRSTRSAWIGSASGSASRSASRSASLSACNSALWRDEWDRCFGSAVFDFAVDFGGTSAFWANLMLQSPGSERSIWLRDTQVTAQVTTQSASVAGQSPRADELAKILARYNAYDHLVSASASASPALDLNTSTSLAAEAAPQKFAVAESLIGGRSILARAALPLEFGDADSPVPDWLTPVGRAEDTMIFASFGRLSVENDPSRLIRAFALVHAAEPGTRLMMIGHGPLATSLAAQTVALGLADAVWLAGYRANPFALMQRSDCCVFVGRGARDSRELFEARVMGLPSVIVGDEGRATEHLHAVIEVAADDRAIADGMLEFLDGPPAVSSLDWAAHDDAAINMFYRAVGALRGE